MKKGFMDMRIRRFKETDVFAVADLAMRTFEKFNGLDFYDEEAITNTLDYFDTTKNTKERLLEKFSKKSIFFIAEDSDGIAGMINGVPNRISSLFVESCKQGKGIGKMLLEKFEIEAKACGSSYVSIESSLYAVDFYRRMGFHQTSGIVNHMGLKVCLMEKEL